jgi:hypothetical protein
VWILLGAGLAAIVLGAASTGIYLKRLRR